jgi:hypothetical protein
LAAAQAGGADEVLIPFLAVADEFGLPVRAHPRPLSLPKLPGSHRTSSSRVEDLDAMAQLQSF